MKAYLKLTALVLIASIFAACQTNNITHKPEWKKYFDDAGAVGTFAIYDNGQGHFSIYNMKRYRDSAYLPASTFKIFNSLVAIGTGRAFSDTVVMKWDGQTRLGPGGDTMTAWNKDMDMREAFALSNLPFYQELARRIGRDTMQQMLDSLKYGNARIGGAVDSFWLDNSLKITADEELGFVKKMYFKQLPFQNREQEIVKNMMIREKTDKYILAYKTGWGKKENGHHLGWMVGWIEENAHPYFFVLNLESAESNFAMPEKREKIMRDILASEGFFKGLK